MAEPARMHIGIDGVRVGHYGDPEAATGCTALLVPEGAVASLDVRGGAPGTRETDLLSPYGSVSEVHGLVLTGGSAFGLAAADGVVSYLAENGFGYATPYARVPLVPAAVIYDLGVARSDVHPRAEWGYEAARAASREVEEGSVGAGTGATVGKILGEEGWMKGGFGAACATLPGDVQILAMCVVNAFGDVLDEGGRVCAGARSPDGEGGFLDTHSYVAGLEDHPRFARGAEHTTLAAVVTDARLDKTGCGQTARMAQDGLARAISPVHTPVDGDTVFVFSAGKRTGNVFQLGCVAADLVAQAIRRAVRTATPLGGVPALGGGG